MIKFLIVIIFLVNCLAKQISCAKDINEPRPRPYIRLRTFAIHSLKTLRDMRKAYELQQKMQMDAERQLLKVEEDLQRRKEKLLREKVQLYLGPSSFYKDFLPSRFF